MMEKLEHAELKTITLHNHSVHWYKKGKEIAVNSTLFDVHTFTVKKDSTVFTGLFDTKETALKNHVKKLMEQKNQENSSRDLVIAKLMLQLWITNDNSKDFKLLTSLSSERKYIITSHNLISADISIPFPPPKA